MELRDLQSKLPHKFVTPVGMTNKRMKYSYYYISDYKVQNR